MTFLVGDSFDACYPSSPSTADFLPKWTSANAGGGLTLDTTAARTRFGAGSSLRTLGGTLSKVLPTARPTIYFGTWLVLDTVTGFGGTGVTVISVMDGATYHVAIAVFGDGSIRAYRGQNTSGTLLGSTSTLQMTNAVGLWIEGQITVDNSAGIVKLFKNGDLSNPILNLTSQDTQNGASAQITTFNIGGDVAGVSFLNHDDVYLCDDQGSVNNGNLGNYRPYVIRPTGAGSSTQWTPDSGSNYARVNETTPDGDSSYVSDNTAGHIDLYAMADLPAGVAGTVAAVCGEFRMRVDDATLHTVSGSLKSGTTTFHATAQNVGAGAAYGRYQFVNETNQDTSAAFTVSDVNGLEAGQKLVS